MMNMKIKQLSIFLQNRMGSLSKPLEVLSEADVNIRAMCMADTSEFGILRLVVDNPERGKEALEENSFLVKITEIIGVEMNDTPGGLTSVLKVIKDNEIDLEYLYAFTSTKVGTAYMIVKVNDVKQAGNLLQKKGIRQLSQEELKDI